MERSSVTERFLYGDGTTSVRIAELLATVQPADLVGGPNVLRLQLDLKNFEDAKLRLREFLLTPTQVDWERIGLVFAQVNCTIVEANHDGSTNHQA